jgi:hypothetical protein
MRHPLTTVRSWLTWEDTLDPEYDEKDRQYINPEWVVTNLYKNVIMADQLYDVDFIPVDSPYKEDFLRKFNQKHRTEFITQWRKENSIRKDHLDIPQGLSEKVAELMMNNREFFSRFYED